MFLLNAISELYVAYMFKKHHLKIIVIGFVKNKMKIFNAAAGNKMDRRRIVIVKRLTDFCR